MRYKLINLVLFNILVFNFIWNAQKHIKKDTIPVIFDADMGPMIDDVAAIAVLHALASKGEAKILATIGSNVYPGVAKVFDIFNTYYGRPNIPIGLPDPEKGPVIR